MSKPSLKDRILSREESIVVDELHVIKSVGAFEVCSINFVNDLTTEPLVLFYDTFSDRYFYSTFSKVLIAEYHANRMYTMFGTLFLNEFYGYLGIRDTYMGNRLAWLIDADNEQTWIEFNHEPIVHRNIRGYSIGVSELSSPVVVDDNGDIEYP